MNEKPIMSFISDDRGVTWTIEAFLSVALLLAILVITIQMVPSGATSSQQANYQQNQLQQDGTDILVGSSETGQLSDGLLYWDVSTNTLPGDTTRHGEYQSIANSSHPLESPFTLLNDDNVLYNMEVTYQGEYDPVDSVDESDQTFDRTLVYQGTPSDNAVVVEYTVILFRDDPLINEDGRIDNTECNGASEDTEYVTLEDVDNSSDCDYYMPDAFPEDTTDRYNVVRVQLTLWN